MKNNRYLATLIIYGLAILLLMLVQILGSLGCFNSLSDEAMEVVGSVLPQVIIMFGIPFLINKLTMIVVIIAKPSDSVIFQGVKAKTLTSLPTNDVYARIKILLMMSRLRHQRRCPIYLCSAFRAMSSGRISRSSRA